MMNADQITTRLSMMDDKALETFATMHKNDPYLFPLAYAESTRRQRIRMAGQAQQAQPQPKVNDAALAQMRPAPEQAMPQMAAGIPQLAARNIETMADGGIAGYAKGSEKPIFSADRYLQDPRVQRFLEYINLYEGSPKENQTVGYHKFDDLSKHPNRRVKFNKRGDKSTAAGAYQLINRTWQDQAKKQGLEDFSLENQKRAAIGVLKETGALDALMKGDIDKAKQRAARAWASIPGSTIGESTGQTPKFNPRAENVLADLIDDTQLAKDKKPVPRRQQTAGLDPKLAKQITSALPFASAQAADTVPRKGAPTEYTRSADGRTISGPISAPRYEGPRFPQTPPETGIAGLPKRDKFVDPLAKQREQLAKEFTPPSGREVGSAVTATGDYLYNLLPFAAGEAGYAAGRMFGVPEESAKKVPEFFAGFSDPLSRFFKTKDTPEDKAALTRKIEKFVGENINKGAEWIAENSEKYTSAPISVRDAENIMNSILMFGGLKGRGKGKAKPASTTGVAEAKSRIADAEAAAATAAENVNTAAAPRLEPPKAEPSRAANLQQRFAEAQEQSAKALETADLLATSVVDGKLMTGKEKAAALRASMPKIEGFTPDPAAQQLGVKSLLERKRREQAKDVLTAKDAARAAESEAARVKALEEGRIAEAAVVPRTTTPAAVPVRPRTATAAVAGSRGPIPGSYDDIVRAADLGSQDAGIPLTPPSDVKPSPAPVAEEKAPAPAPTAEQKKAFGLDNEDLLMLGLGMLASPGGQAGGELSQVFSNFGRAGLGAVAAKREREKLAQEKSYKDVMEKYYGKLTEMYGRPELIERQIAEVRKANPGMGYLEAMEKVYAAQYGSRMETEMEKARIKAAGPFAALTDYGLMEPGTGSLTPMGLEVFRQYYPKS